MTTRSTKTKGRTVSAAARSVPLRQPPLGPIEQVPIDLLRPYDRNARTHNQRQIAKIAASLEAFGWMNPLLAEADGTIIAGHGRWTAARTLGMTHVPVLRAEHLSADQARAYRLADNRLAELAGWDDEILTIELQHLSTIDLDYSIEVIGWDGSVSAMWQRRMVAGSGRDEPQITSQAAQSVSPVQLLARGHPPRGHDVCTISAVAAEGRGPARRARHRYLS